MVPHGHLVLPQFCGPIHPSLPACGSLGLAVERAAASLDDYAAIGLLRVASSMLTAASPHFRGRQPAQKECQCAATEGFPC